MSELTPSPNIWFASILLLPLLAIIYFERLAMIKQSLLALLRMLIQLSLIGIYLEFLFQLNHWGINLLWLAIMLTTANLQILKRSGLSKQFFPAVFASLFIGCFGSGVIILLALMPENLFQSIASTLSDTTSNKSWQTVFDARQMIPLTGMILGNSLQANLLALERFYSEIRQNPQKLYERVMLGGTLNQALRPWRQSALKVALAPTLATMATLGIVFLPGLMTGQILAGIDPFVAIQYQILIMLGIFSSITISCWCSLKLSQKIAFDSMNRFCQ
ncbi:ABC transporter permease [Pelagibaculum spongiae]|uniref:ABC transporter permease n=1 Tax=Pelagibaculum spongiae TaxID=2080658 RepID=A0A2V1H420_9GAMM|nr:ABC transporter permease [Pelagibaculum spongiae]PVZ70386.1 ABC transporter permease [Pelagibaculum spongiae]